jgi:hypothetical protein
MEKDFLKDLTTLITADNRLREELDTYNLLHIELLTKERTGVRNAEGFPKAIGPAGK